MAAAVAIMAAVAAVVQLLQLLWCVKTIRKMCHTPPRSYLTGSAVCISHLWICALTRPGCCLCVRGWGGGFPQTIPAPPPPHPAPYNARVTASRYEGTRRYGLFVLLKFSWMCTTVVVGGDNRLPCVSDLSEVKMNFTNMSLKFFYWFYLVFSLLGSENNDCFVFRKKYKNLPQTD